MSSVIPSPSTVRAVFEQQYPSGTPLTTNEIAEEFNCTARTIYNRLETLVDDGAIQTKKVGARGRVWWQPSAVSNGSQGRQTPLSESTNSSRPEPASRQPVVAPDGEGFYRQIFNQIFQFTGLLSPDGILLEANDAALSFGGVEREAVIGTPFWEAPWWQTSPEVRTQLKAAIERAADGEFVRYDVEVLGEDRTAIIDFSLRPMTDNQGAVTHLIPEGRDITEIKEQADRIEQQRDRLKAELGEVFDRISDGFIGLDDQLRFTYVNDHAEELLDIEESTVRGQDIRDVLPVAKKFENGLYEARDQLEPVFCEVYYEPLAGWFDIAIYPSETGISYYFRDITDQKEQKQQLESTTARLTALFENSPDMIDVHDPDGRLVDVNRRLCSELGYTESELLGRGIWEVDQAIDADGVASLLSELSVDEPRAFEARYQRADGSMFPVEVNLIWLNLIGKDRYMAISRDITERKQREQDLHDRVRQQEVVTELGERALRGRDLDGLMAEASQLVVETLGNDYCMLLELDSDAQELLLRQGIGWNEGIVGSATVSSVEDGSQAAYTLSTSEPVSVEDLETETRFGGPELLRSHDVRSGISTLIGSVDEPWGILSTHDTEPVSISDQDINFVQSVATILATAINRHSHEQELLDQREQLAELNNINRVIRELTDAIISQSTREEIEQTVCNCLAEADSYEFAWIADVDAESRTLAARAEAGLAGYLDEVTISIDPDGHKGQGPASRAVQTGEMQITQDTLANPDFEPWQAYAETYEYQSIAAIPIVYDEAFYGVLGVYAAVPNAFGGEVRAVIGNLGEIVGHAIAATERKQALMSTELTELQFTVDDVFAEFGFNADSGTIRLNQAVPIGDGVFLEYGTADDAGIETLQSLVDCVSTFEAMRLSDNGETSRFELRISEPPIVSTVASHGGSVQQTTIEDGDLRMTIHLPPTVAARRVMDAIRETYPTATLLRRRQITRSDETLSRIHRTLSEELTDRQRSVLETAVYSGFFEWPRTASGSDISESLGVSPPTFHQHLRVAQKKLLESVLLSTSHS